MNFTLQLTSEGQAFDVHYKWQVQMEHGADQKDDEAHPWQVDVDHSTAECDDGDSVLITATVTSKAVICSLPTNLHLKK
jgi:hypothetical protein